MTNIQSIAGSFVWGMVAAVLMLITFEPVSVEQGSAQPELRSEVTL